VVAYGVACAPHNLSGPVSCAASVHLSLGLSHFLLLEYPWPPAPWRAELCGGTERIEGGAFLPPEAPGLSLAFDPAVAAKHRADG
ncbi:MAG: enolase C-terminal domain-like protein, partial [Nitrospinota bacterium]